MREVHDVINQRRPAQYSTILKFMQIMAEKGLVLRDESLRAHVYRSTRPREWTPTAARWAPAEARIQRIGQGTADRCALGAKGLERGTRRDA